MGRLWSQQYQNVRLRLERSLTSSMTCFSHISITIFPTITQVKLQIYLSAWIGQNLWKENSFFPFSFLFLLFVFFSVCYFYFFSFYCPLDCIYRLYEVLKNTIIWDYNIFNGSENCKSLFFSWNLHWVRWRENEVAHGLLVRLCTYYKTSQASGMSLRFSFGYFSFLFPLAWPRVPVPSKTPVNTKASLSRR